MRDAVNDKTVHLVNQNVKYFYAKMPRCVILDKRLTPTAKLIYIYLTARCNYETGSTWISQSTAANDLGLTREAINRNIKVLKALGLLIVEKQPNNEITYYLADIAKLYGDAAKTPWGKTDHKGSGDFTCDPKVTTLVTPESQPCDPKVTTLVILESQKEEEPKNQKKEKELKIEEESPDADRAGPLFSADLKLANKWLEFALNEMPWAKSPRGWNAANWAKEFAKIRKQTGLDHEQLSAILTFIQGDNFWRQNTLSPKQLLSKNKGGVRKIDTLLIQIKNSRQFREKRPLKPLSDDDFIF